jgi:hypothetical protein
MVKSGYAKGANSGHITQERTLKPKPARRKGVRNHYTHNMLRLLHALLLFRKNIVVSNAKIIALFHEGTCLLDICLRRSGMRCTAQRDDDSICDLPYHTYY